MAKLEALEYHSNEAIRTAANHILDMYYGDKVLSISMNFGSIKSLCMKKTRTELHDI